MLSELGVKSTVPLTLKTLIQRPESTRPSQRHVSESRPNCCCAPMTGAANRRATIGSSFVLFIFSPGGCTAVDHNASAEGLCRDARSSVTDGELNATFPSPRAGRNRNRKIRRQVSTEGLDTELRSSAARNVQPQRSGMRF